MAIEFRCGQCGKLLRTGDDTAGKQAKCPSCGSIQPIPLSSQSAASPIVPLPSGAPSVPNSPFGASPAVETMNPYQAPSPQTGLTHSHALGGKTYRPTKIDIGDVLSQSWEVFKANYWYCVGMYLILGLIGIALTVVFYVGIFVSVLIAAAAGSPLIALPFIVLMVLALMAAGMWLNAGVTLFWIELARSGTGDFALIFSGGPYFVRVLLATFLIMLISIAVSLVCGIPAVIVAVAAKNPQIGSLVHTVLTIFPSIYLTLTFLPVNYLIVDQGLGTLDAVRACFKVTKGNKLAMFATLLVAVLFGLLGILGCFVGVLFTMPFVMVTMVVVYLCMTGQATAATRSRGGLYYDSANPPARNIR